MTARRAGEALDARAGLVDRVRRGDHAAFAAIVRIHDSDMTRVCPTGRSRTCGSRSRDPLSPLLA
jgi:hypothetical protein